MPNPTLAYLLSDLTLDQTRQLIDSLWTHGHPPTIPGIRAWRKAMHLGSEPRVDALLVETPGPGRVQ